MRALTILSRKTRYSARGVSAADIGRAIWTKSTFSNMNGNCVEIGRLRPGLVGIRDTKDNGGGPVLAFTAAEWDAFIAGAKDGQFDNL